MKAVREGKQNAKITLTMAAKNRCSGSGKLKHFIIRYADNKVLHNITITTQAQAIYIEVAIIQMTQLAKGNHEMISRVTFLTTMENKLSVDLLYSGLPVNGFQVIYLLEVFD